MATNERKRHPSSIGKRAVMELLTLYDDVASAAAAVGRTNNALYAWLSGRADPPAEILKRMVEMGLDVVFILTGRRSKS